MLECGLSAVSSTRNSALNSAMVITAGYYSEPANGKSVIFVLKSKCLEIKILSLHFSVILDTNFNWEQLSIALMDSAGRDLNGSSVVWFM